MVFGTGSAIPMVVHAISAHVRNEPTRDGLRRVNNSMGHVTVDHSGARGGLPVEGERPPSQGSSFMLTPNVLATCHHVIHSRADAVAARVRFHPVSDDGHQLDPVECTLLPDSLFMTSSIEDYTLVAVRRPDGAVVDSMEQHLVPSPHRAWMTDISRALPRATEPYAVRVVGCHSTNRQPYAFAFKPLLSSGPATRLRDGWPYPLRYEVSTLPGYSGGMLVDLHYRLLGMHMGVNHTRDANEALAVHGMLQHAARQMQQVEVAGTEQQQLIDLMAAHHIRIGRG